MSLRINVIVGKLPKILFWALLCILAIGIVKVAIWEYFYYLNQEGTKRYSIQEVGMFSPDPEEVDETAITPEQLVAHTVATDKPRYLSIPAIGVVDARIKEVGLTAEGAMATIANIFDVGWYRLSGKPGQIDTMLVNGHNGGPTKSGVFKQLDRLVAGDLIIVERGDGIKFEYKVIDKKILPLDQADAYMSTMQKSPVPGKASISLISCAGDWSQSQRTYLSRAMVRAAIIE